MTRAFSSTLECLAELGSLEPSEEEKQAAAAASAQIQAEAKAAAELLKEKEKEDKARRQEQRKHKSRNAKGGGGGRVVDKRRKERRKVHREENGYEADWGGPALLDTPDVCSMYGMGLSQCGGSSSMDGYAGGPGNFNVGENNRFFGGGPGCGGVMGGPVGMSGGFGGMGSGAGSMLNPDYAGRRRGQPEFGMPSKRMRSNVEVDASEYEAWCPVCEVNCKTINSLRNDHSKGKRHVWKLGLYSKKNNKGYEQFHCQYCYYSSSVEDSFLDHLRSEDHRSNLLSMGKQPEKIPPGCSKVRSIQPLTGIVNNQYHCFPCKMSTKNLAYLEKHLSHQKHLEKFQALGGKNNFTKHGPLPPLLEVVKQRSIEEKTPIYQIKPAYWCNACLLVFQTARALRVHAASKAHKSTFHHLGKEKYKLKKVNVKQIGGCYGLGTAQIGWSTEGASGFFCFLCNAEIGSADLIQYHVESAQHVEKEARINISANQEAENEVGNKEGDENGEEGFEANYAETGNGESEYHEGYTEDGNEGEEYDKLYGQEVG